MGLDITAYRSVELIVAGDFEENRGRILDAWSNRADGELLAQVYEHFATAFKLAAGSGVVVFC